MGERICWWLFNIIKAGIYMDTGSRMPTYQNIWNGEILGLFYLSSLFIYNSNTKAWRELKKISRQNIEVVPSLHHMDRFNFDSLTDIIALGMIDFSFFVVINVLFYFLFLLFNLIFILIFYLFSFHN